MTDMKRLDLYEEHAKEKEGLPQNWRIFRWECFPHGGREPTLYVAVTGAVCEYQYLRGKRKGRTNWSKRNAKTEATVNLLVAEHDKWKSEWEQRTGNCSECTGTGQVFSSWSITDGTTYRDCRKCNGRGLSHGEATDTVKASNQNKFEG